jgi:hypothetical protein
LCGRNQIPCPEGGESHLRLLPEETTHRLVVWRLRPLHRATAPLRRRPPLSLLPPRPPPPPKQQKKKKKRENIQGERGRIAAVSEGGRRPGVAAGAHPPGARCRCRWRAPPWAGSRRRGRLLGVGSVPFSLVRNPSSALIGWGCSVYSGSLFSPLRGDQIKIPPFPPISSFNPPDSIAAWW